LALLEGFVLKPSFSKKTRGQQFFFVNRRFIRSTFLHHSVISAYEGLLQPDHHPGYILFLEVDPETIDINIHPNKTEIKFEDEQSLYAILRSAIKHSLGIFQVQPLLDFNRDANLDVPYTFKDRPAVSPSVEVDAAFNPFSKTKHKSTQNQNVSWEALFSQSQNIDNETEVNTLGFTMTTTPKVFFFFSKYIVCALPSGLLIIHQNRAHQRVLYEQFLTMITNEKGASQQLLFPIEVLLDKQQKDCFKEIEEMLSQIGFQWNTISSDTIEIKGIPNLVAQEEVQKVIEEILMPLSFEQENPSISLADTLAKKLAQTLAIKSGNSLEVQAQQQLIDNLFGCKETLISPLNKRIFITLEKEEIEQKMM